MISLAKWQVLFSSLSFWFPFDFDWKTSPMSWRAYSITLAIRLAIEWSCLFEFTIIYSVTTIKRCSIHSEAPSSTFCLSPSNFSLSLSLAGYHCLIEPPLLGFSVSLRSILSLNRTTYLSKGTLEIISACSLATAANKQARWWMQNMRLDWQRCATQLDWLWNLLEQS